MIDKAELWMVIAGLGVGSFGLRFLFLGLVGDRPLPEWMLRHLRYTAVSILPALVAPLVVWPAANDGQTDPLRLLAALVALGLGYWTRSVFPAMAAGAAIMLAGAYWPA